MAAAGAATRLPGVGGQVAMVGRQPQAQFFDAGKMAKGTLCLGIFAGLFAIPLLFAFLYHSGPTVVLVIIAVKLFGALLPLGRPHYAVFISVTVVSILGAAAVGLHIYYAYSLPLINLRDGRLYHNVYAQQPAAAYSDASSIIFAGNATVDDTKGFGMSSLDVGVHTFCVAPIVDEQSVGRVEFWAVGMDCCKNRGDFVCDDAGVPHVRTGVVLSDRNHDDLLFESFGRKLAPPLERRDLFLKAIKRAERVHEVISADNPVLVRWTATSLDVLVDEARARLAIALIVTFLGMILPAACLTGLYRTIQASDLQHQGLVSSVADRMGMPKDTPIEVIQYVRSLSSSMGISAGSRSNGDIMMLGFLMPLFVGLTSVVVWTWLRCWKFGDIAAIIFGCLSVGAAAAIASTPRKFMYGLLLLICAVVGGYIGNRNYLYNTFHYCAVENHRTYNDVAASASANEYRDAGKIFFESSAAIRIDESLGLRRRGTTYCAAPIIGPGNAAAVGVPPPVGSAAAAVTPTSDNVLAPDGLAPQQGTAGGAAYSIDAPTVDFWAVGKNCCDSRGKFECAGDGSIASGLVFRNAGSTDETYESFVRAVQAAAENYDLPMPKDPILVRWAGDLDELRSEWAGRAMGVTLVALAVFVGVLGTFSTSLWCCARCARKADKDAGARRQQEERLSLQRGAVPGAA
eukprot:TRINITY_DN84447_c0_g1_i1.p1 TRINITY_DN84447_c0_g1~~TRINITY_DN84447_c0_g1_i1.p1  ORF type:complete len:686 (+),score=125.55 TRINITY_DN84447_c0_g1_i1:194-2251(+)